MNTKNSDTHQEKVFLAIDRRFGTYTKNTFLDIFSHMDRKRQPTEALFPLIAIAHLLF
jgi:hypothetical protein